MRPPAACGVLLCGTEICRRDTIEGAGGHETRSTSNRCPATGTPRCRRNGKEPGRTRSSESAWRRVPDSVPPHDTGEPGAADVPRRLDVLTDGQRAGRCDPFTWPTGMQRRKFVTRDLSGAPLEQ